MRIKKKEIQKNKPRKQEFKILPDVYHTSKKMENLTPEEIIRIIKLKIPYGLKVFLQLLEKILPEKIYLVVKKNLVRFFYYLYINF